MTGRTGDESLCDAWLIYSNTARVAPTHIQSSFRLLMMSGMAERMKVELLWVIHLDNTCPPASGGFFAFIVLLTIHRSFVTHFSLPLTCQPLAPGSLCRSHPSRHVRPRPSCLSHDTKLSNAHRELRRIRRIWDSRLPIWR
jgi:hypothetical protein